MFYNQEDDTYIEDDNEWTPYQRAEFIAHMSLDYAETANAQAIELLDLAQRARTDASRLLALVDAGEPHNSGLFKSSIRACQHTNRERKGFGNV